MKRIFGVLIATFTLVSLGYSQSFFFADADLEFEANVGESEILVSLTTGENDKNNYVFERSSDGVEFERLSSVKLKEGSDFKFVDHQPVVGKSFYRLVQSDDNGQKEVIDIRQVHYTTMDRNPLKVSATSTDEATTLTVESGAQNEEMLDLEVYNMRGELVVFKNIAGGVATLDLQEKLKSGIYSVTVSAGDVEKSTKLLVQ